MEPVHLFDLAFPVQAIAAGANHLVAITRDHQLYTWGCGEQGQLGRRILSRHKSHGLRPTNVTPRRGRSMVPIVQVACGSYHTLALAQDGTVYAMGLNNYGQLGLGDNEDRPTADAIPADVWHDRQIVWLAAGEHHSLALASDGSVFAFGRNDSGQLGIAEFKERASSNPLLIPTLSGCMRIAVGGNHSLALTASGQLYSWGYGEMGQLGHGVERDEAMPRLLKFTWTGQIQNIAAGGQHSLVLSALNNSTG